MSSIRLALALCASLLLSACQSQPQRFDGHRGYETAAMNAHAYLITYTEEATASWAELQDKTRLVCQQLLPQQPTRLRTLRRDIYTSVENPLPEDMLVLGPITQPNQNPPTVPRGSIPPLPLQVEMKKTMVICEEGGKASGL